MSDRVVKGKGIQVDVCHASDADAALALWKLLFPEPEQKDGPGVDHDDAGAHSPEGNAPDEHS